MLVRWAKKKKKKLASFLKKKNYKKSARIFESQIFVEFPTTKVLFEVDTKYLVKEQKKGDCVNI